MFPLGLSLGFPLGAEALSEEHIGGMTLEGAEVIVVIAEVEEEVTRVTDEEMTLSAQTQ